MDNFTHSPHMNYNYDISVKQDTKPNLFKMPPIPEQGIKVEMDNFAQSPQMNYEMVPVKQENKPNNFGIPPIPEQGVKMDCPCITPEQQAKIYEILRYYFGDYFRSASGHLSDGRMGFCEWYITFLQDPTQSQTSYKLSLERELGQYLKRGLQKLFYNYELQETTGICYFFGRVTSTLVFILRSKRCGNHSWSYEENYERCRFTLPYDGVNVLYWRTLGFEGMRNETDNYNRSPEVSYEMVSVKQENKPNICQMPSTLQQGIKTEMDNFGQSPQINYEMVSVKQEAMSNSCQMPPISQQGMKMDCPCVTQEQTAKINEILKNYFGSYFRYACGSLSGKRTGFCEWDLEFFDDSARQPTYKQYLEQELQKLLNYFELKGKRTGTMNFRGEMVPSVGFKLRSKKCGKHSWSQEEYWQRCRGAAY